MTQIIGIVGNALLVVAYIPQIVKIIKTKKAEDLSIWMWIAYFVGDTLLLIYAITTNDTIFTMLFSFFTVGNFALLGLTYKYGNTHKKPHGEHEKLEQKTNEKNENKDKPIDEKTDSHSHL